MNGRGVSPLDVSPHDVSPHDVSRRDVSRHRPSGFDAAIAGCPCRLVDDRGAARPLLVARWHAEPDATDLLVLDRCTGPTLDVGCGPGRLAAELTARGVCALGVDVSTLAVRLTRLRGAAAIRRNVFDRLPGEGRWRHVLLADGNIGIGGDPVKLLARCAELTGPGGRTIAEFDPAAAGVRRHLATVQHGACHGLRESEPFRWATVGPDAIPRLSNEAGLRLARSWTHGPRVFAEFAPRSRANGVG